MTKKFFFLILLSLCNKSGIYAQRIQAKVIMESRSNNPQELVYKKGLQLKFSDFQGTIEEEMHAIAMAYTGVSLQYSGSSKNGNINLQIQLFPSFNKARSWCMDKHKEDWTLAHEQRHFDITIINACKLYRALASFTFSKNFDQEITALQTEYREKSELEQVKYDEATNHGINKAAQREWNQNIQKLLEGCQDCYP